MEWQEDEARPESGHDEGVMSTRMRCGLMWACDVVCRCSVWMQCDVGMWCRPVCHRNIVWGCCGLESLAGIKYGFVGDIEEIRASLSRLRKVELCGSEDRGRR